MFCGKIRFFSLINITGLALGITAFILILEYVSFEQSTNQFHTQLPHLYRILLQDGKNNALTNESLPPALTTEDLQAKIKKLETIFSQTFPDNPCDYFFQDENYNKQYQNERQYSAIFTVAAILAIFIACLGLFGLTLFTVQQRTKEIGIRKVLGASVSSILLLISKDYLLLIGIAFLIVVPVANYFNFRLAPKLCLSY